jgi:hypothetical protein
LKGAKCILRGGGEAKSAGRGRTFHHIQAVVGAAEEGSEHAINLREEKKWPEGV